MQDASTDRTSKRFVFVPDADGVDGSWYLESVPSTPAPDDQTFHDEPSVLNPNPSWYPERSLDCQTVNGLEVADRVDPSGRVAVEESPSLASDANTFAPNISYMANEQSCLSNTLTPNTSHVTDEQSSLSITLDTVDSGNNHTYPDSTTPDHQLYLYRLFPPDASGASNARIDMGSHQTSKTGQGAQQPDITEADDTGPFIGSTAQSGVGERGKIPPGQTRGYSLTTVLVLDNLFFRADDGTVVAIRIDPSLGPDVLRDLSRPTGTLNPLPTLPFASTPPATVDDGPASDAQPPSSTANASAPPSSPAPDVNGTASGPSNRSASVPRTSAALSSMLSPAPGSGIVDLEGWVDGIFSSANGQAYNRDWISRHNVNEDILKGDPSKHKLDMLFRHGAVIVGDRLRVTYHSSGNPVVREGVVSTRSVSDVIPSNMVFHSGLTGIDERQSVRADSRGSSKLRRRTQERERSERSDQGDE